jgi:hypothetical protein
MLEGLLPIGTVVLLKEGNKRLMIIGVVQKQADEEGKIWDYAGCLYPEGYISAEQTYLFNGDQIDRIFALGFQDEEQFAFKPKAEEALKGLRA